MKKQTAIITVLTGLLLAGLSFTGCATEESQSQLAASAKISKAEAEKTALAKVPGGTIKSAELEKEDGKIIWTFDINTPGTKDITEVNVDAMTGDVVAVEKETAESGAKEKKDEEKK